MHNIIGRVDFVKRTPTAHTHRSYHRGPHHGYHCGRPPPWPIRSSSRSSVPGLTSNTISCNIRLDGSFGRHESGQI